MGTEVMLLDDDGEKVGAGDAGEIVVRSRYQSDGYWMQPELTAQKFRPDPREPEVIRYYTGDRGRLRDDGALEILGRKDSQVKIRGYRVQLEVIDRALLELEGVKDAATIVHRTPGRGAQLVAYVKLSGKVSVSELRRELSARFPDYMVPTAFVRMKELPRTGTGKLARGKLPEPSVERPELETAYKGPRNEIVAQIAEVWQGVLGLEQVGVDDNFFELGGDSLMALEMTLGVEKVVGRAVPQEFFKQPSISVLVALLEADGVDGRAGQRFVIKSKRVNDRPSKRGRRSKLTRVKFKKLFKRVYSLRDLIGWLERQIYFVVARHIASKPYLEANRWVVEWSQNAFVRKVLYRRKYALFSQWVTSLDGCQVEPSEAFQMSLLTNLRSGLPRYAANKRKVSGSVQQGQKRALAPYWRTYGELLDAIPVGQMSEHFPISGAEYVKQAYERGKGVILLTFHGSPIGHRLLVLERFLDVEEIPTISWRVPARQSRYRDAMYHRPEAVASTMNSEIGFYGQRLLQEGSIINIVADTSDNYGTRYRVELAGREYQVKSGFAELALNTGAAIIPHYTTCLPDGRVQLNLLKPLEAGEGDRDEKIERLIGEYFSFINDVWVKHPEVIKWHRMEEHFSRDVFQ